MKEMLTSLRTMKVIASIDIIAQLLIPIKSKPIIGFSLSIFVLTLVIILVYGLMNGLGYGHQNVPILGLCLVRGVQVLFYTFVMRDISFTKLIVLVCFDGFFIVYLLLHKSKYEYVIEEEIEDATKISRQYR